MNICNNCIYVDSLKKWICSLNLKGTCNICNSKNHSVVKWDDLLNYIKYIINHSYIEAQAGNLPIRDIMREKEFEAHTKVKTKLIKELESNRYFRRVDADIESIPSKIFPLSFLWEKFQDILKYKCRFFSKEYTIDSYHKPEKAEMFFSKLNQLIKEFREECLIYSLDESFPLYRARDNSKGKIENINPFTLGAPSPKKKIYPTRTSPVGIPIFYSSTDKYTAIKEIQTTSKKFIVGQWRLNQSCLFIDVSKYNISHFNKVWATSDSLSIPDSWSIINLQKRDFIQFLSTLNSDFSKEITKDNKSHIEYLPTQIISEYFKTNYSDICGIIYKSSVSNGKNIAIFNEKFKYLDMTQNQHNQTINTNEKTLILESYEKT